jgi:histidine ammonia-lyase
MARILAVNTLTLDGASLTPEALLPLARGAELELAIAPAAKEAVARSRAVVDRHVEQGDIVYGLTTGFGRLKNVAIDRTDLVALQRNLVLSHCCGVGEPMPTEEVRLAQVFRLNSLLRGYSGIRVKLVEALVRLFNKGFVPVVPRKGSVGASGDLAPLAHMAAAYLGHGEACVDGRRMSAADALRALDEAPLELQAKEGLALINGTEVIKAVGFVAWSRATMLSKAADVIGALTLEALFGSLKPFDPRLAELKGSSGHARTASNVRRCLDGSAVLESHTACDRVQDAYSLRCIPQIHGACKTALEHVGQVLAAELNAITDNPVVFPETGETISAGMFHGQPLSMALDYLTLSLCTLANVSERRIERLVNPDFSGLPAFLTPRPGVNSGLMIAQVAAAALASENKALAHPASVDTIPTSAGQEDHVSMGAWSARKAREVVENVERVLAIEWLCASQGREFHQDLTAGKGAAAARACLREIVPPLEDDRFIKPDIDAAHDRLVSGALVAATERAVGPLEP